MSNSNLAPFHLAIAVKDLPSARNFYGNLFDCPEGRSDENWVDFDFFGHQLVCHVSADYPGLRTAESNAVDGHAVPIPHFGIVMEMAAWRALADRLRGAEVQFIIEPYIRFEGEPGEQATMFLYDPSGNAIEFKAFQNIREQLFAK